GQDAGDVVPTVDGSSNVVVLDEDHNRAREPRTADRLARDHGDIDFSAHRCTELRGGDGHARVLGQRGDEAAPEDLMLLHDRDPHRGTTDARVPAGGSAAATGWVEQSVELVRAGGSSACAPLLRV